MNFEVHKSVLLKEVIDVLNPQPGETYFDGTVNGGGHARRILKRVGGSGMVIGFDWDADLIKKLRNEYPEEIYKNFKLECANYADAKKIFSTKRWPKVNGILLDLGFSSYHIEKSAAGFSFQRDEPLDMRYHREGEGMTAYTIINNWKEEEIATVLREYGEERFAEKIAEAIIRARRLGGIKTSGQLADLIQKNVPSFAKHGRIHPATRSFQALRIAVNHEFENIATAIQDAPELLLPGGIIAVISFHSLEDRVIKNLFKEKEREGMLTILTKKVIRAAKDEVRANSRARSAKLRAAVKR